MNWLRLPGLRWLNACGAVPLSGATLSPARLAQPVKRRLRSRRSGDRITGNHSAEELAPLLLASSPPCLNHYEHKGIYFGLWVMNSCALFMLTLFQLWPVELLLLAPMSLCHNPITVLLFLVWGWFLASSYFRALLDAQGLESALSPKSPSYFYFF